MFYKTKYSKNDIQKKIILENGKNIVKNTLFKDINLNKLDLENINFIDCEFNNVDAKYVKFCNSHFINCNFSFCDFGASNFYRVQLHNCIMQNVDLLKTNFHFVNLNDLKLIECIAFYSEFKHNDFTNVLVDKTHFNKSIFQNCIIPDNINLHFFDFCKFDSNNISDEIKIDYEELRNIS